jgi:hypothetical protein
MATPPEQDAQSLGWNPSEAVEDWSPYPLQLPIMKTSETALFKNRCHLSLIVNDISIFLLRVEPTGLSSSSVAQVVTLFERLDDWYGNLSPEMILEQDPTPHKIILQ